MSRDDDEDGEDDRPRQVPFPGSVMAAGVIWIGSGCLGLLIAAVIVAWVVADNGHGGGSALWLSCFIGGVAVAFLQCGYWAVTGTSSDMQGYGIGSMVLGVLQLGVGCLTTFGVVFGGAWNQHGWRAVDLLVCGATDFLGPLLVTAGALALSGRTAYLDWREVNAPSKKRRRRDDDF